MSPADFIYEQVYRGAIKVGAREPISKDCAIKAMDDFKRNKFQGKAAALVGTYIKEAKRRSK